ncbi:DNA polymerase III subunit beta [Streptomyces chartreusis]|uniref:DNA polymerase III subunit beta n=1 Tax=Streptomyces chartreusis TaxID=1969 RepID=UPI00142EF3C9|nr:DNA polymerase III subunit beta [Streptomyces chartreusis]
MTRRQFADLLAWAAAQLDAKPTQPIYAGLLIDAGDDTVTIGAASHGGGARATLPADVMEPGRIVVPGRMAAQVVGAYRSELIELATAQEQVELAAGRDLFRLSLLPAGDYPAVADQPDPDGTVDGSELAEAVRQAVSATDPKVNDLQVWRSGIQLTAGGDRLTVWATDRYRMAERTIAWTPARDQEPVGALVVGRSLVDAVLGLEGAISLSLAGKTVGIGDRVRYSTLDRLDEAGRQDPHRFIPAQFTTEAVAPAADLISTVKRACLVAGDGKPKILLGFGSDDISVRAAGDDTGAVAMDYVDGRHIDGPSLQIAFQPGPLLDALTVAGTDEVRIGLTGPTKPALVHAVGDDTDYQHLVMPVRL